LPPGGQKPVPGVRRPADDDAVSGGLRQFLLLEIYNSDVTLIESTVPLQASDAVGTAVLLFQLLLFLAQIVGMWVVFGKAGEAGWKVLVPVYNLYVMLKIGNNAWWWLLLLIVPVVNFYAAYKVHAGVARAFGKGVGFALGLTLLGFLFFPVLAFGDYQYRQSAGVA
jgi:hypothetical protein